MSEQNPYYKGSNNRVPMHAITRRSYFRRDILTPAIMVRRPVSVQRLHIPPENWLRPRPQPYVHQDQPVRLNTRPSGQVLQRTRQEIAQSSRLNELLGEPFIATVWGGDEAFDLEDEMDDVNNIIREDINETRPRLSTVRSVDVLNENGPVMFEDIDISRNIIINNDTVGSGPVSGVNVVRRVVYANITSSNRQIPSRTILYDRSSSRRTTPPDFPAASSSRAPLNSYLTPQPSRTNARVNSSRCYLNSRTQSPEDLIAQKYINNDILNIAQRPVSGRPVTAPNNSVRKRGSQLSYTRDYYDLSPFVRRPGEDILHRGSRQPSRSNSFTIQRFQIEENSLLARSSVVGTATNR